MSENQNDQSEYQDLSTLQSTAEEVPGGVQSEDYSGRRLTPPGRDYVSPSREIKARQKPDKSIVFAITFTGGLVKEATGRVWYRPDRTWVSTKQFSRKGNPGKTSGVAEYLSAFIDPATGKRYSLKGISDGKRIAELVAATAGVPVRVRVGWENQTEKTGELTVEGKPVYEKATLFTRDFRVEGTEDSFTPEVSRNGKIYVARERVEGFSKV